MSLLACFPSEEEFTHDHNDIAPAFDMLLTKLLRKVVSFLVERIHEGSVVSPRAIGGMKGEDLAVGQQRLIVDRANIVVVDSEPFLDLL